MNSVLLVCSVFVLLVSVKSLRIPENPCPNVFSYFRKSDNREVYGEVNVPYDGHDKLVFTVNASMVGYFKKAPLRIQLVTPLNQIINGQSLTYNIFFPFLTVVPKITQIIYNGEIFCSGPAEPIIPGSPGITNVWSSHVYSFSNFERPELTNPSNTIKPIEDTDGISEFEIPIKDPSSLSSNSNSNQNFNSRPDTRPNVNRNPFVDSNINIGLTSTTTTTLAPTPEDETSTNERNEQCGIASNLILPLILGGTQTEDGQYPWMVAMLVFNKNIYEYKCTANLISDRHVITAARCVQYYSIRIVKMEDILFVLGKSDLTHWATNGAVTRGAINIQTHPYSKQNPQSAHGDMAVITMDNAVKVTANIRPVCLWDESSDLEPFVKKLGTLAAWGVDENSPPGQLSVLHARHVEIPIVSQFDCLKSDMVFRNSTSEETFCAGDQSGRGPCIGDSGAGFIIAKKGIFYLRGIASLASSTNGSCDLKKYVVFCDVAKFTNWVIASMDN